MQHHNFYFINHPEENALTARRWPSQLKWSFSMEVKKKKKRGPASSSRVSHWILRIREVDWRKYTNRPCKVHASGTFCKAKIPFQDFSETYLDLGTRCENCSVSIQKLAYSRGRPPTRRNFPELFVDLVYCCAILWFVEKHFCKRWPISIKFHQLTPSCLSFVLPTAVVFLEWVLPFSLGLSICEAFTYCFTADCFALCFLLSSSLSFHKQFIQIDLTISLDLIFCPVRLWPGTAPLSREDFVAKIAFLVCKTLATHFLREAVLNLAWAHLRILLHEFSVCRTSLLPQCLQLGSNDSLAAVELPAEVGIEDLLWLSRCSA